MSVYVDDMRARHGRLIMCHMTADTTAELLGMAAAIKVDQKWVQHFGESKEHFDICLTKRAEAVLRGAIQITQRMTVQLIQHKRKKGVFAT